MPDRRPSPTAPAAKADDQTIQLNVFEVLADKDDSYGALNSNSITRFNTELATLPISADVYNEAFMRDVNASTVEQMISDFTAGAGFASSDGPARRMYTVTQLGMSFLTDWLAIVDAHRRDLEVLLGLHPKTGEQPARAREQRTARRSVAT